MFVLLGWPDAGKCSGRKYWCWCRVAVPNDRKSPNFPGFASLGVLFYPQASHFFAERLLPTGRLR